MLSQQLKKEREKSVQVKYSLLGIHSSLLSLECSQYQPYRLGDLPASSSGTVPLQGSGLLARRSPQCKNRVKGCFHPSFSTQINCLFFFVNKSMCGTDGQKKKLRKSRGNEVKCQVVIKKEQIPPHLVLFTRSRRGSIVLLKPFIHALSCGCFRKPLEGMGFFPEIWNGMINCKREQRIPPRGHRVGQEPVCNLLGAQTGLGDQCASLLTTFLGSQYGHIDCPSLHGGDTNPNAPTSFCPKILNTPFRTYSQHRPLALKRSKPVP